MAVYDSLVDMVNSAKVKIVNTAKEHPFETGGAVAGGTISALIPFGMALYVPNPEDCGILYTACETVLFSAACVPTIAIGTSVGYGLGWLVDKIYHQRHK